MTAGDAPPPPCFSDVVAAQKWAAEKVKEVAQEAERRGRRGSQAWEDAWRDALWTLAVQKRCVEAEARKSCAFAAQGAIAALAKPAAAADELHGIGAENAGPDPRSTPSSFVETLCREAADLLEARAIKPVQVRLSAVEGGLERLAAVVHALRAASPGACHADDVALRSARFESEALERTELELRDIERRLRVAEADSERAREQLLEARLQAEEEGRRRAEVEQRWTERNASLQRQLRRTEAALREARNSPSTFPGFDDVDGCAFRRPGEEPAPSGVAEALEQLRNARLAERQQCRGAAVGA
eukprot:TRINITY_DN29796_c0_g1_i1.p1 TRINITY_DN29796_c0_g1~~TRINITY_DN29796_c0_g1_i1.p1  ORF type:complete len:302 (-),score=70.28 TRINITY_DN29796_c0_g1_i1:134-1039(-)